MSRVAEIKKITEELLKYAHAYYDLDCPILSDAQYDKLYDELKAIEDETGFWLANSPTRKVQGAVLDCFKKVKHSKPMLSAAKTKDVNDIKKFLGNNDFYCSYKLDGLTMVTRYDEHGDFIQAITRGNGEIGEDITEQAKMIANLPMHIQYNKPLELRGECVIDWESFNKINETLAEPYSHPRNLAAGSLRQLDTNITKERCLSYIVFECVSDIEDDDIGYNMTDSKWDELNYVYRMGFEVVNMMIGSVDDIVEEMKSEDYKYPVDGLVFELNSKAYSKSLTATSHHEGCRMALKWADDMYETTLRDVEWNTTRSGIIAPVAVFDPVDLSGAITTRATLHNISIIEQLELGIGDVITVYRANMVVPKVDDNLTRSNTLKVPKICPCCGQSTIVKYTDNSKVLMCTNDVCPAKQLARFTHFVSRRCANIDGLSEKTLELLISHGFLHSFRDIYHLYEYKGILTSLEGFGEKSVSTLLKSIENSRDIKLENFINALGIPGIGLSAAKTISDYFHGDHFDFTYALANDFDFTKLTDFGETMNKSLYNWWESKDPMVELLPVEMHFIVEENKTIQNDFIKDKIFVVTGAFQTMKRSDIENIITQRGGKLAGSVSTKTNYLLTNEANSGSSKAKKAAELGIPVMDENTFIKMIGE